VWLHIENHTSTTTNSHYTGQFALAGTHSQELEEFIGASFTAHMPLLTAASVNITVLQSDNSWVNYRTYN